MDLFSQLPDDAPVTSDEMRNLALVRRMRVLLHADPLFRLGQSDARREPQYRHYDTLAIALKILDVIAERMGMDVEADREYLDFSLSPLLGAMDRRAGLDPDPSRHAAITDRVLGALRNDGDARRPFRVPYTDVDAAGDVTVRQLEFRLVQDAFGLDGGLVMRLTNEAVNLNFNALELDLEDAQAATEAIVHSQMMRGRFDEARRNAHYAVKQSRLYCDRLRRMMRDTRRDISRVDWGGGAPRLISEAMSHLDSRLDVERNIIASASDRLDSLQQGTPESLAVARVLEAIRYCVDTHTVLQRELMTARTTFLDSQARQAFVSGGGARMPELVGDVVEPVMGMPAADALEFAGVAVPLLTAPAVPSQVSLGSLFDGLLRPKRQLRRDWIDLDEVEPEAAAGSGGAAYTEEDIEIVTGFLRGVGGVTTLSELLGMARLRRLTPAQCGALVLLVMQHFDTEGMERPVVRVDRAGTILSDPDFFGDEVVISPYTA